MILTIIVFLLILTILVLIHEAGHFLVAKRLGIKVEEFGFGLPPRAFGIKRGETIYSLNWLPIGGFVKLYGEDEAGGGKLKVESGKLKVADKERAFFARSVSQRATVVLAGVVMNFILAVAIISYIFGAAGVQIPGNRVTVADVAKGSPAQTAGLLPGDVIEKIDNTAIISPPQLIDITKKKLGKPIMLLIKTPKGKTQVIRLVPRKNYPKDQGPMGIAISPNIIIKKYPWYQAPFVGTWEALKDSWLIVAGLGTVIYQLIVRAQVPQGVAGPVGIAQLTGQFVAIGPLAVLSFVALLSLNLAILNVLPIPALDGGRLFFIIIEWITGRKVNQKFEGYAHAIGMALLLALIAVITLHDLLRIFSGQPLLPKP